jgi:hypothetical protein
MAARRIDVREVPRDESRGRWDNALERLEAMDRQMKAGSLDAALVLAVHAVIAACDAFTIGHLGERCASERHLDAPEIFARVKGVPGMGEALGHLKRVLREMASIEYSGHPIRREYAERLVVHARRFAEFVRKNLPQQA